MGQQSQMMVSLHCRSFRNDVAVVMSRWQSHLGSVQPPWATVRPEPNLAPLPSAMQAETSCSVATVVLVPKQATCAAKPLSAADIFPLPESQFILFRSAFELGRYKLMACHQQSAWQVKRATI